MNVHDAVCWLITIAWFGFLFVITLVTMFEELFLGKSSRYGPGKLRGDGLDESDTWFSRRSVESKDPVSAILLRPAAAPDTDADTLLRPALSSAAVEIDQLLRAGMAHVEEAA